MTRLYLIRHGRPLSGWSDPGADMGADPGLDAIGRTQAQEARDWLTGLPPAERPRRVVSSPLRRCRETAQATAEALGVQVEIAPAVGEIPTPAGLAPAERAEWLRRAFDGNWAQIAGGLDYQAWRNGVVEALREQGGAAVFTHFVAINAVLSRLAQDDRVVVFRPDHASITVLDADGNALALVKRGREAQTSVL